MAYITYNDPQIGVIKPLVGPPPEMANLINEAASYFIDNHNKRVVTRELVVDTSKHEEVKAPGKFEEIGMNVGALVDEKNAAYGDSFNQTGKLLAIMCPNGISVERYPDLLCFVRSMDKWMRIFTDKDAFGESPYKDLAGYAILGYEMDIKRKPFLNSPE
mgnify:CR=1 FL=1